MRQNSKAHPCSPDPDLRTFGHVVGVQASGDHRFSKTPRASIRLIENHGVEGDVHAGANDQHLFHIRRYGEKPNLRQVHLIGTEFFDDVGACGHVVRPGDLGENISTSGIDLIRMPTGTRLIMGGEALVELTGLRNPCHQIDDFQPGLLRHCKVATPHGVVRKAGVMAVVLHGGIVRPGDEIAARLPPGPHRPLVYRPPVDGSS